MQRVKGRGNHHCNLRRVGRLLNKNAIALWKIETVTYVPYYQYHLPTATLTNFTNATSSLLSPYQKADHEFRNIAPRPFPGQLSPLLHTRSWTKAKAPFYHSLTKYKTIPALNRASPTLYYTWRAHCPDSYSPCLLSLRSGLIGYGPRQSLLLPQTN